MNKKNITLMVVAIATLITFVGLATYAYFVGNINTTRTSNVTATTERNNLVFDTNGGAMQLNVSAASMQRANNGTVAAQNSTTLTVNLTANTDYSMVCTYDIIYEWTSSDKYTAHSSGVTSNEFTIKASLASNSNTYEGTNNIANETDLSSLTYTNNSATVVSGAQIDATGSTRSTAVWTLESKIYNVNANQTNLVNKNFGGRFKITNVSCVAGNVTATTIVAKMNSYFTHFTDSFPYEGTTYDTGLETGQSVYIGQDDIKYYTCATIQEKEVCLSQPYTQYGLEGHTVGSEFTSAQQSSAIDALGAILNSNGLSGYNCTSSTSSVSCSLSGTRVDIRKDGTIGWHANNDYEWSYVFEESNQAKAAAGEGVCFKANTEVLTKNGYINIENIQTGDDVYSYNEETGNIELRKVTETFVHNNDIIYVIKVGFETIEVTKNHPLYVRTKYSKDFTWITAGNIKAGDYLYSADGKAILVNSVKMKKDDSKVYNFSVDNNHTYYVSRENILVHNVC